MLRYIFREFDEAVLKRPARIYFVCIFAACILANTAVIAFRTIYGTNEGTFAYNIMEYAAWSFIVAYLSCICIAHMIFGSEYPDPHIKDGITVSLNRTQIYLSKLIAALMLAAVFLMITFVALVTVTALFQIHDKTLDALAIRVFCGKLFLALPLFTAGISFGMMFLFLFEDRRWAYAGYFILTLAIPRLIMFIAGGVSGSRLFKTLRTYTISQCFTLIPYTSSPERKPALIVTIGLLYSVIATAVGLYAFNRKKI